MGITQLTDIATFKLDLALKLARCLNSNIEYSINRVIGAGSEAAT